MEISHFIFDADYRNECPQQILGVECAKLNRFNGMDTSEDRSEYINLSSQDKLDELPFCDNLPTKIHMVDFESPLISDTLTELPLPSELHPWSNYSVGLEISDFPSPNIENIDSSSILQSPSVSSTHDESQCSSSYVSGLITNNNTINLPENWDDSIDYTVLEQLLNSIEDANVYSTGDSSKWSFVKVVDLDVSNTPPINSPIVHSLANEQIGSSSVEMSTSNDIDESMKKGIVSCSQPDSTQMVNNVNRHGAIFSMSTNTKQTARLFPPSTLTPSPISKQLRSSVNVVSELGRIESGNRKSKSRRKRTSTNIIKWIYERLCNEDPCVEWIERSSLTFRIVQQHKLAELWGEYKNNSSMNFNKFA